MRNDIVTYENVCIKINEMLNSGDKINVRNVRSRTGGASARIAEFIKRWHDENTSIETTIDNLVSDTIQQAIIADRNAFITKAVKEHQNEIVALNALLQEMRSLLNEQEELCANKSQELLQLQTKIIEANQRNITYQELIEQLEHKLEQCIKVQNNAITESATALLQLNRADSLNVEMKQQIHSLQEQLLITSNAKYSAEKDAAVWQSKYEQLEAAGNRTSKK
jgi:chromosome segregation ATPase